MKTRLPYIIGFLVLLGVEICIGVFYFNFFIRAYIGDVIVVWVIYCLFRSFVPKRFSSYAVALGILAFVPSSVQATPLRICGAMPQEQPLHYLRYSYTDN